MERTREGWPCCLRSTSTLTPSHGRACSPVRMHTDEAHGPADEGVEVASSSIDVGLGSFAPAPPRLAAEDNGLSDHDLTAQGSRVRLAHAHGRTHGQEQQRLAGDAPPGERFGLTEMAGPANARLSSISRGMSSWAGSMYGRLRLRSRQLKPTSTGLKMSVHSRKYRLTAEDMRMGICPPEKEKTERKRSEAPGAEVGTCGPMNSSI